jgi:hypothetical protein
MPLGLNRKILGRTMYRDKKIFPNFYLSHTFYEMQNDAERRCEKTKKRTNARQEKLR